MSESDEYVEAVFADEKLYGPKKWLVLIFGPNHQMADFMIDSEVLQRLNIIIV